MLQNKQVITNNNLLFLMIFFESHHVKLTENFPTVPEGKIAKRKKIF